MTRASSWIIALLLGVLCMLCVWSPASADTPPTQIAAVLQQSSVYVDVSIGDADAITSRIKSRLNPGDDIYVVVLDSTTQASASSTARAVAALSSTPKTVLVASATDSSVVAMSSWPPQVEADDLLARVASVVQNPTDLALRFVQSVHEWQDANPKPKPPVPPVDHSTAIYGSVGGVVCVLVVCAIGFVIVRRNQRFREINGAPRRYRRTLRQLLTYRDKFVGTPLAGDITQICTDAVYFFRDDSENDQLVYRHLENVVPVLRTYAKVQNDRRYYEEPDTLLEKGEASVRELREFVYAVAQHRNRGEVNQYEVNTRIVQDARNSMLL